jgi:DNA-directed RNA polymerase subunit RPC12/RpoP
MENQLQVIVQTSGLDQTKADYILTQFTDYFKIAAEWETKAKSIIVTNENQTVDMQIARVGRLFLREQRIKVEKARKTLKEQALREGKAIDGIANVLKALIEPIEEYLEKQEKFIEIKAAEKAEQERIENERKVEAVRIENERKEKTQTERRNKMFELGLKWEGQQFTFKDINFHWTDLICMSDEKFEKSYEGAKIRKAQIEKLEAEEQNRIKLENEKLKIEAIEKEKKATVERLKLEEEKRLIQEKAQKEKEAADRKARLEREKQENILADQKMEAEVERKKQEEILAKQKAANEKAKQDAKAREEKLKQQASQEVARVKEELKKQSLDEIECPYCHKRFVKSRTKEKKEKIA